MITKSYNFAPEINSYKSLSKFFSFAYVSIYI